MYRHIKKLTKNHEVLAITEANIKTKNLPQPCKTLEYRDSTYSLQKRILSKINAAPLWYLWHGKDLTNKYFYDACEFKPDLILTVWHGPLLITASRIAEKLKIPLVLVVHDDWEKALPNQCFGKQMLRENLQKIYRQATSRILVSEGMKKELLKRYGSYASKIIYPIPNKESVTIPKIKRNLKPIRLGFFGELSGHMDILNQIADLLEESNATLTIFSHTTIREREVLAKRKKVFDLGSATPKVLKKYFQHKNDVVIIPQCFHKDAAPFAKTNFPSKLPEACQFGLPLLVVAPKGSSAANWGKKFLPRQCCISSIRRYLILNAVSYLSRKKNWEKCQKQIIKHCNMFSPKKIHFEFEQELKNALNTFNKQTKLVVKK